MRTKISHLLTIFILKLFFCNCEDFTLNVSEEEGGPNFDKINKTTYHINGIACRKLSPKPHNRIVKVSDGKTLIWVDEDSECTGIIIYPEVGHGRLLHLFIAKSSQNIHEYFFREGDQWKKIDGVKYKERMNEFLPDRSTDPAKPTGKRKKGSTATPNIIYTFSIPFLLYAFSN